ncbi:DUF4301 family protein [Flavobacterium sp. NST-5]|uniref:DUF4301 family protein n=1 Tax=Flavobacterium ichthyis TaxID=2698827 RepID=A0ABW9Z8W7_9FLAO|nr:DUF4301 family protein [Flavobacterium ichthyis]NBL63792.1 DUF4301 family protein [Flavobacterium ichthyis]
MEENFRQRETDKIKIAIYGPESTGKTTLAKQLSSVFQSVWVAEFAREYLQKKWDEKQQVCQPEDLIPIALGQIDLENKALAMPGDFVFCDTNLLCTKVFSEIYYGFCDAAIDKAAQNHQYDLTFFTDIDVPFEPDDLRDKPNDRPLLREKFLEALQNTNNTFIILSGNQEQRLAQATKALQELKLAKQLNFSSKDFLQAYQNGISFNDIKWQKQQFSDGIPKMILHKPASLQNGITALTAEKVNQYSQFFDSEKHQLQLQKFVPASGAASRMFKFLSEFLNDYNLGKETINAYINRSKCNQLPVFMVGLEKFPFYESLLNYTKAKYQGYDKFSKDFKMYYLIKSLLHHDDFDYLSKPKAVLPFHQYPEHIATPIEEHLNETVAYATSNNAGNIHFTLSQEHQEEFIETVEKSKQKIEEHSLVSINVSYSYQHKKTDTLAVDFKNNAFRDQNHQLFFRPGGHGALIENLNHLSADIIFIKNIDNVIQNHIQIISNYKKALAGLLLELRTKIFSCCEKLDGKITAQEVSEIKKFIIENLSLSVNKDFSKFTLQSQIQHLQEILNRPIRVCGMVQNEGEPGGGPFWILDTNGNFSLQIVESSQVDLTNLQQQKIFESATHFNPVDLVCSVKNYQGKKFDLKKFIDPNSGFIVEKTKNGTPIKAYELPGLWNGAMANWITIFVEVPLITFNPVKTVNDLLKPAHQPQ